MQDDHQKPFSLRLEDIEVDSFDTLEGERRADGTVHGYETDNINTECTCAGGCVTAEATDFCETCCGCATSPYTSPCATFGTCPAMCASTVQQC